MASMCHTLWRPCVTPYGVHVSPPMTSMCHPLWLPCATRYGVHVLPALASMCATLWAPCGVHVPPAVASMCHPLWRPCAIPYGVHVSPPMASRCHPLWLVCSRARVLAYPRSRVTCVRVLGCSRARVPVCSCARARVPVCPCACVFCVPVCLCTFRASLFRCLVCPRSLYTPRAHGGRSVGGNTACIWLAHAEHTAGTRQARGGHTAGTRHAYWPFRAARTLSMQLTRWKTLLNSNTCCFVGDCCSKKKRGKTIGFPIKRHG